MYIACVVSKSFELRKGFLTFYTTVVLLDLILISVFNLWCYMLYMIMVTGYHGIFIV